MFFAVLLDVKRKPRRAATAQTVRPGAIGEGANFAVFPTHASWLFPVLLSGYWVGLMQEFIICHCIATIYRNPKS